MEHAGNEWFAELRSHIAELRQADPLPERDSLSDSEEWMCRIIGGALLAWLKEGGPIFLQQRSVMIKALDIEEDPFLVFTLTVPGLIAASEIVGPQNDRIVYLAEDACTDWLSKHPDDSYKWHIHAWSEFRSPVDDGFLELAKQRYPITENESYWQHREGTMWAPNTGRGVDHLWKWNGVEPVLLEEALDSRNY